MASARKPDTSVRADDAVGWTIVRAGHFLAKLFEDAMRQVSLTPAQFGVLAVVAEQPGIGSGQLARRVLVTPQSVGEIVAALEAVGHLARDRSGGRGRRAGIELTPQGRALLGRAFEVAAALNEPGALGLDAAEMATVNTLLHRVLRTVAPPRRDPA